ncbi:MAG: hypothetical protein P1U89_12355 [Verrucomicrobiales bacterium]|nr:hypothetical protein [Verrucomicrobiales bacterium]
MSDPGDESSKDPNISIPPIKLPEPDPFDTSGAKDSRKQGKKAKKQKKGRHPLDQYKDVRKERKDWGCCGGLGCFALLILLIVVGGVGYCGYILAGDFKEGYEIVQLKGAEEIISTAPTTPTVYINSQGKIIYDAPATSVALGLVGQEVEVNGSFADNLLIRGVKVTCNNGTHVQSDLNIYAVEYQDNGVRVDGEKKGKVLQ